MTVHAARGRPSAMSRLVTTHPVSSLSPVSPTPVSATRLTSRRTAPSLRLLGCAVALVVIGCNSQPQAVETVKTPPDMRTAESSLRGGDGTSQSAAEPGKLPAQQVDRDQTASQAEIGEPAPDFTLKDLGGLQVRLKDFLGKTVVLEWFNPQCPFVRLSHTKGSLKDAAARHSKAGVVWLAINSAAPGKQGHSPDTNRQAKTSFGMTHPLLVDEAGEVGRMYGAERTPHLYVIDPNGILVYRGAVDNSPDGEGASPEGGKLVRYVDQALAELASSKPVSVPKTEPYGCTVKYAD